ncbi:DUF5615 family PIN-like protein [Persephonella sp.]
MKIYLYELLNKYKGSIYVLKSELKGKSDIKVYKFAQKNNLTILTFDTDFLDINTYPLKGSSRTVLRFKHLKIQELTALTLRALKELESKDLNDALVIVYKNKIRIARLAQ